MDTISIWKMHTPKILYSGSGAIRKLDSLLAESKLVRPFVVIDPFVEKTDFGLTIKKILAHYQIKYWSDFSSDPTKTQGENGTRILKKFGGDGIIAIGGGSAIDVAKYISLLAGHLPFIVAVPTTCGTGAECSPFAMIKDEGNVKKVAYTHPLFVPQFVILDPDGLNTLNREMIAATTLDTLAHLIETYTSSKSDELVRISTRGGLISMGRYVEQAIFQKDQGALKVMQYIAFSARLLYPGTGLSIIHSLAHPLGAYSGLHHGMIVAFLMPASLAFNKPACPNLFQEVEELLGVPSLGHDGLINWIKNIIIKSGLLESMQAGLKNQIISVQKIADQAMESSNIPSNPRRIKSPKDLVNILKASWDLLLF